MKTLSGTYVVTGGGSGSGRAIARRLTQEGATVVVWGRTSEKLNDTVAAGGAAAGIVVDVQDAGEVSRAFEDTAKRFGRLSGFVHCAGIWTSGTLTDVDDKTIMQHIGTVTTGAVLCLRGAVRAMAGNRGRIVQIAAASAKPGFSETALNMLAKRAQDGLHEGLVSELKGTGVRLTTIYPNDIGASDSNRVTSGKAMSYEDVADAALWAISANDSVWVQEILLTSPNNPRGG